jgi:multidrug efflux system membrane fusion protein
VSDPSESALHAPESGEGSPSSRSKSSTGTHGKKKGLAVGVRLGLIAVLLVGSLGVFGVLRATREQSRVRTDPAPPLTVRAVAADARPVERVWEGFGTVRSMNRAQVAAEVSGRVIDRPRDAEPGRPVARGQLLLLIDPTDYEVGVARARQGAAATRAQVDGLSIESERIGNQVRLAEEEIEAARRDLERTERAIAGGAGSPGELDSKRTVLLRSQRELDGLRQQFELIPSRRLTLEAQLAGQPAELRLAEENLARTRVISPIDGEIQSIGPRTGDFIVSGTPVAGVVDLARVEVPLRLPASSAGWVARVVGELGTVSLWNGSAVGEPQHVGRVTRFSPEADADSRTITVYVEVEQDPTRSDRLLPGSFVHGRVRTPDPADRVVLPRRAIRSGRVMLVDADASGERRVRVHPVRTDYALEASFPEIDRTENEWVVLQPGSVPPAGSMVAVTALEQLQPGMRVLLPGEEPADAATAPADGGEG